jgi:hypothetical protein
MIRRIFGAAIVGAALIVPAANAQAAIPASGIPQFSGSPDAVFGSGHKTPAGRTAGADDGWQRVGDGITSGLSGIVVDGQDGATLDTLAVRDNKKDGENRLVAVRYSPDAAPQVHPLTWSGELPTDLEAIDAVPGAEHEYVALASSGTAYRIERFGDTVRVLHEFQLPGTSFDDKDASYEGFALTSVNGEITAVWADRGEDERPAKLTAAQWNPKTNEFGKRDSAEFSVPYPAKDVRHISDVKISASGALTVSSASDPGDDGPFDSALYAAGTVSADGDEADLDVSGKPERLATFPGHKIEALACVPGSDEGILGTDDENGGGSVTTAAFCRP